MRLPRNSPKGLDGADKERLFTLTTISISLTGTVYVFVIILIGKLEVKLMSISKGLRDTRKIPCFALKIQRTHLIDQRASGQSSIVTRARLAQSTYHGSRRQGTD